MTESVAVAQRVRVRSGVTTAIWALGVVDLFAVMAVLAYASNAHLSRRMVAAVVAVLAAVGLRVMATTVVFGIDQVRVRNVFRTRTVPVADIKAIVGVHRRAVIGAAFSQGPAHVPYLALKLRDDQVIRMDATRGAGNRFTSQASPGTLERHHRIKAWARQHKVAFPVGTAHYSPP